MMDDYAKIQFGHDIFDASQPDERSPLRKEIARLKAELASTEKHRLELASENVSLALRADAAERERDLANKRANDAEEWKRCSEERWKAQQEEIVSGRDATIRDLRGLCGEAERMIQFDSSSDAAAELRARLDAATEASA